MLENRSFDHLFGFADLPGLQPPLGTRYANPIDMSDPTVVVEATPAGSHLLALDPPHSHIGAQQQMGRVHGDRYAMNGFVDAYRLKLLQREHLPVIRWNRIMAAALGLSPLLAAGTGDLASRVRTGNWWGLAYWSAVPAASLAAVVGRRAFTTAADVARWKVVLGIAGGAVIFGSAARGAIRFAREPNWKASPLCAGALMVTWAVIHSAAKRDHDRRRPLEGKKAEAAAALAPQIMRCMPPDRVRVLGRLAREFTTCVRWFSSVPGATWPNRNFLHSGTSSQAVDIEIGFYGDKTLFELLDDQRAADGPDSPLTDPPWHIYRDGMPHVMVFDRLWDGDRRRRWKTLDDFYANCLTGDLPTYSFIEPRHSDGPTNSFHPGNSERETEGSSDFARGEELVRTIYHSLRDGKQGLFERSLLVITFDEHGGFFDRESPPRTVHPAPGRAIRHPLLSARRLVAWFIEHKNAPFDFKRFGVRVPTVVISPLVDAGIDTRVYDHTSVIATVRDLFAPDQPPLGNRSRKAKPFWHLVNRRVARRLPVIPPPDYEAERLVEGEAMPPLPVAVAPHRGEAPRQDDDLSPQLEALARLADVVLDERGAPKPAFAESTSMTARVNERLTLWGT